MLFKIEIDKEFEKKVGALYIENAFKNSNFWFFDRYFRKYPELIKIKDLNVEEAKNFFNKKVDELYANETIIFELQTIKPKIEKEWNQISKHILNKGEELFDGHKWSEGEYKGYLSIFGMFRFIRNTKTFSLPSYNYTGLDLDEIQFFNYIKRTITHEMYHILFEDFFKTYFGDIELTEKQYIALLEVVNTVILNLSYFIDLFKLETIAYPNHKIYYDYLKDVYPSCKTMKEFIGKAIQCIQNN